MNFVYEPVLLEHMHAKGKTTIVVETVMINHSEIELMELHIHLIDEKQAEYFVNKQRYVSKETAHGRVLLPPYRLHYDETVTLGLKKVLFPKMVTCEGIRQEKAV